MDVRFAYLAEDKLYFKSGDAPPRLIESPFAQSVIDRTIRDRQRNEWKTRAASDGFAGRLMWNARLADPSARQIEVTGLTAGNSGGELCYALRTDTVGGLFIYDLNENHERRIFHRNGFRARDLCRHPKDGTIALSMQMDDGTANLAIIETGGRGVREITEGDSVDQAPAWLPGEGKKIVFQSAGVARDRLGHVAALGPYAIQQLDFQTGELTTLLEQEKTDYLLPKPAADGSLYYIKRPYEPARVRIHPFKLLVDILLFPIRLAWAIVAFLNFFSLMFARKPLITAGGPQRDPVQQRSLMLFGKVVDAEKSMQAAKNGEAVALVPSSWQLIRRASDGTEQTLAKGVLAFDLCPDGSVVYTNGSAVFRAGPDGQESKVCEGKMIEHVVALPV